MCWCQLIHPNKIQGDDIIWHYTMIGYDPIWSDMSCYDMSARMKAAQNCSSSEISDRQGTSACGSYPFCTNCIISYMKEKYNKKNKNYKKCKHTKNTKTQISDREGTSACERNTSLQKIQNIRNTKIQKLRSLTDRQGHKYMWLISILHQLHPTYIWGRNKEKKRKLAKLKRCDS